MGMPLSLHGYTDIHSNRVKIYFKNWKYFKMPLDGILCQDGTACLDSGWKGKTLHKTFFCQMFHYNKITIINHSWWVFHQNFRCEPDNVIMYYICTSSLVILQNGWMLIYWVWEAVAVCHRKKWGLATFHMYPSRNALNFCIHMASKPR